MIWIGYTAEGFLVQVAIGDSDSDPLGAFGDIHRQLSDAEAGLVKGLDAHAIHTGFCVKGGTLTALPATNKGKIYYPDTKHFIDPADRGVGPRPVNPTPPTDPTAESIDE
jgi:hypothetical protein